MTYPNEPGYKEPTTSKEAAEKIKPKLRAMQQKILDVYERGAIVTADRAGELAGISVFSARPRCTELVQLGFLEKAHRVTEEGSSRWALRAVRTQREFVF